jgi:hypothetical protein
MPAPPPGDDDEDTSTPHDLEQRIPASAERRALGTLEATVFALAGRIGELRREFDRASPNLRRALAEQAAVEARSVGDNGHDLARLLEDIARGRA